MTLTTKKTPISVFIDLSKAFDTINHEILIGKPAHYNLDTISLNWFRSYLSNRHQIVKIEGVNSGIQPLKVGVPQGSVLGPLLFIIYVNDLCNATRKFKPVLFADDTTLISSLCAFISNKNPTLNTSDRINEE